MHISTFNEIQTVKYTLQSRKKTAVELFKREDVRYREEDCTSPYLTRRSAGTTDGKRRQQSKYGCQSSGCDQESKMQTAEEEKRASLRHMAKQQKWALETLVQAKKKKLTTDPSSPVSPTSPKA